MVGGDDEARHWVDGDGGLAAELVGLVGLSLGDAVHVRFVEAVDPLGAGAGILACDDAHDAEQFSKVREHLGRQLPVQFAQQTPCNRADPSLSLPRRLADLGVLVAVAPGGDAQLGNGPGVGPALLDPVPLGKESAALDDLQVEFREGGVGEVFLLGRRVDHHIPVASAHWARTVIDALRIRSQPLLPMRFRKWVSSLEYQGNASALPAHRRRAASTDSDATSRPTHRR
jgi:hypothetical protein